MVSSVVDSILWLGLISNRVCENFAFSGFDLGLGWLSVILMNLLELFGHFGHSFTFGYYHCFDTRHYLHSLTFLLCDFH